MEPITISEVQENLELLEEYSRKEFFQDDLNEFFDKLAIVFWNKYSSDNTCSFCNDPAHVYPRRGIYLEFTSLM